MNAKRSIIFCIVFIKQIFFTFLDLLAHFFIVLRLQQMCEILKATVPQSSNSKRSHAIALKYSAKQINLIRKKTVRDLQNN